MVMVGHPNNPYAPDFLGELVWVWNALLSARARACVCNNSIVLTHPLMSHPLTAKHNPLIEDTSILTVHQVTPVRKYISSC